MPQPFIAYSPEEADVYEDFGRVEGVGYVKHFGSKWEAEQQAKADAEKAARVQEASPSRLTERAAAERAREHDASAPSR